MVQPLTLEESALQSERLREIEDLLPVYVDIDSDSRKLYWLLIEQRTRRAMIAGCTNQDIFNSVAVSRGLKAPL